jgi:radical SAM protein with 4Fe4S-binding SPASM domain
MAIPRYDGDPRHLARWHGGGPGEPPRVAVWEITLACDLACRHCGSRAGHARPNELSTAEALDLVEQLAALGVREVILIGGEAYLRDDWADIANAITRAGLACSMVTGGRHFDAFRVEQALAAGVQHIGLSIDGLADTHDAVRGPGSFAAARATAHRIAATRSIGLSVNTQINRLSMPELPAIADLLLELGVHAWQVQLTVALGRAADRPDLLLQPYHLLDLFPLLAWVKRDKLDPAGIQLFCGNNVGYFGPYERELRYGGHGGHSWAGCGAGRSSLGIEADGTIKGCPSLPTRDYTGGNVRDLPLEAVWRSAPELQGLANRTRADLWGFCADCEHADACKAGCTWTTHALFGRPGNNPYCHHRALVMQERGLRERVELEHAAPGEPFDFGRFRLLAEPIGGTDAVEEDSPVPLTYLARLFAINPSARSLWPKDTLRRTLASHVESVPPAGPMSPGRRVIRLRPHVEAGDAR